MDLSGLGEALLKAGAPVLKTVISAKLGGGIGGALANAAIDTLANALGTQPTPEAIVRKIEADPMGAYPTVQAVEQQVSDEMARIAEANRDIMVSYHKVLLDDANQEGWLSRRWRPIFALVFTLCFALVTLTFCRAIWVGDTSGLDNAAGVVITLIGAGCAVLGVNVWQRSQEKKAGVA